MRMFVKPTNTEYYSMPVVKPYLHEDLDLFLNETEIKQKEALAMFSQQICTGKIFKLILVHNLFLLLILDFSMSCIVKDYLHQVLYF